MKYEHLIGLEFKFGDQDCYGILRRFYKDNFDIELPNIARPHRFWEDGLDLYGSYYYELGFRPLDCHPMDYRYGDVALMAILSTTPNHIGIFLENGRMLHHMINRRSEIVRFGGMYRNNCLNVFRHKDVVIKTEESEVEFIDIVPERTRQRIRELTERASQTE